MRYISFCPGSDLPRVWAVPQDLHPEARERQVRKRYVTSAPSPPPQKKKKGEIFLLWTYFVCGGGRFRVDNQTHFRISGRGKKEYFFGGMNWLENCEYVVSVAPVRGSFFGKVLHLLRVSRKCSFRGTFRLLHHVYGYDGCPAARWLAASYMLCCMHAVSGQKGGKRRSNQVCKRWPPQS